jgi:septal ring factor EnvC (AmiA/AmiB activator)
VSKRDIIPASPGIRRAQTARTRLRNTGLGVNGHAGNRCAGQLFAGRIIAVAFGILVVSGIPAAFAQSATATTAPDPAVKEQRERDLEAARASRKAALAREEKLKAEIAAIGEDRAKLNAQLIEAASAVRGVETRIAETEDRIKPLDAREQRLKATLDSRRGEIAEVLAALQRAGRRAPPALFVKPEDALQSLRTAMLLGAVVPDMRGRVDSLVADLNELVAVRKSIALERDRLASDRERLDGDRQRLAALVDERQKRQTDAERQLMTEREQAADFARQADNLQDLIAKMEAEIQSAARAAAAASLQGAPATVDGKPDLRALKDPGRLSPAIAFASARNLLPLPVTGVKLRDFGNPDGMGGTEKGLSIATRPNAQVTTPCDGWVVYAGPFRSYGQLLILNAGGGYHVLLAGMDRISVNIGQFVLTGEPVATMGSSSQVAALLATAPGQPVLYVEFRKDGTSIDPSPWWAVSGKEKGRG